MTGPKEREGRSAGTPVSTEPTAWLYNPEYGSVRGKSHGPLSLLECPGMGALSAVTQAADCLHPGLEGLSLEARPGQEAGEPKRERWAGGEGPVGVAESLEQKPAGRLWLALPWESWPFHVQGAPGDSGSLPAVSGIPRQADPITGLAGSVPDPGSVRSRDSSQNPASPWVFTWMFSEKGESA